MVDVNPVDDSTLIIVEDEDEILLPSGVLGTSLEEILDEEPLVISENGETLVIQVVVPGPRGVDGEPGADGREVEIGADDTYLRWRFVGDDDWQNLILLEDLRGPAGESGGSFARGMPKDATTFLGVPSIDFTSLNTMTAGIRRDMNPFEVESPITVSAFNLEVVFTGSETTMNVGIIAADRHSQPTGPVLAQANLAVSTTGVKRQAITPVQLPIGRYLLMHQGQNLGTVTLRSHRSGSRAVNTSIGTTGLIERLRYTHTSGQALSNARWTQIVTQNFGQSFGVLMEYEYV